MSFFDRFKPKSQSPEYNSGNQDQNQWDNLSRVPFNGNKSPDILNNPEAAVPQRNPRQERKLSAALIYMNEQIRNPYYFSNDYENGLRRIINSDDATPEAANLSQVHAKIQRGEITDQTASAVISKINPDVRRSPEMVMQSLSAREQNIFGYFTRIGWGNNWNQATPQDLSEFYQKFPTPIEFEQSESHFLDRIEALNSPSKRKDYEKAMESFKQHVFGKRYEYYRAYQGIKADALRQQETFRPPMISKTERLDHVETLPADPEVSLRQLNKAEQKRLLKRSITDGDTYLHSDRREYKLTNKTLEQYGLSPMYQVELQSAKINLSPIFDVHGRPSVIAYVETPKGIQTCSYYRSSSQAVWRLLPDYTPNSQTGTGLGWYGKGNSEESMTLPSELQASLEYVIQNEPRAQLDQVSAEFAFCGTAKRYADQAEYIQCKKEGRMRGAYWNEVSSSPVAEFGGYAWGRKDTPETLRIDGPAAPNFSHSFLNYQADSSVYGHFKVQHFHSKNGKLRYSFSQDDYGRAWLGGIETNSPITSTGLRRDWVKAGDIATPIYEYKQVVDGSGYGDAGDEKGHYIGMWRSYVSKIPLIQDYLNRDLRRVG